MKIFNVFLASQAVFGAEKCHLPVSISMENFIREQLSFFNTFALTANNINHRTRFP